MTKGADKLTVVVIGGGPAGIMAAGTAAAHGVRVMLLERNEKIGRKLMITGKGRCNITNACERDELIKNIPVNGRFLYSAFERFSNEDLIAFFESRGVKTKVERGGRVFPESDRAVDVVDTLNRFLKEAGVTRKTARAKSILLSGNAVNGVLLEGGERIGADAVVLATGGMGYPQTGSTGDGYKMAAEAGHTIAQLKPSLVPLMCEEEWCRSLSGLTLKNIGFKILKDQKAIYSDFGEMLFTHFGISGPVVLSASSHIKSMDGVRAVIDLKPALTHEVLDRRILRDFEKYKNRDFLNSLDDLLPKRLTTVVCELSGIPPRKKVHEITREERHSLGALIKGLPLKVTGFRPMAEAIVTSGGVSVKEINPKTMESKIVKGLYFAGEIIDVDGYTGGFNLQIAFSTGFLAGSSICQG